MTWINNKTYTFYTWTVFGQPTRTTNDVEGWHHRLNKKNHLLSTSLLYEEASMLPVQRRLVSESKLSRFQGSLPRTNQSTIFSLWDQYTRTEITTKRLLQLWSSLNGPTLDWWISDTNVYFLRYLVCVFYKSTMIICFVIYYLSW